LWCFFSIFVAFMDSKEIKKLLPIGKSFFDKVIEENAYYVDKTLFIKELLDKCADVTLCARPRRFGKTHHQFLLQKNHASSKKDNYINIAMKLKTINYIPKNLH